MARERGSVRAAVVARLVAALAEPGCPVCGCLEGEARRDLAAFLREQVMDPAGRATLRAAGGYCAWHTGLLREAADGILSVALLAEALLVSDHRRPPTCPACAALEPRAAGYLRALIDGAGTPPLRTALETGPGVPCRPHLRQARRLAAGSGGATALEGAMAPRLERLGAALAGFIAKQDYRRGDAPTAEERQAWSEALEHLAGRPALFGSALARE